MISVSVIVPAYNAAQTLDACLEALETQTRRRDQYEIIVVDDGSTDCTAQIAQRHDVQLVRQLNAGPAAARNRGAEVAHGELLLFTDADCAPAADWIERMVEPFTDPSVVGAKGVYRTRQEGFVARFVQLEYEGKYQRMSSRDQIDFVDTYSAAYRREPFLENGGFDVSFSTASVEDQELSFRLARKGYRLVFVPDAVVHHVHDATLLEYWRRKFNIGYWKALLLHWHPERVISDSHTPQMLKVQIGIVALFCLTLLLTPFWTEALWGNLVLAIVFFLSSLSFVLRAVRRDPRVVLVVPVLMSVRALALGMGLAAGLVRFWSVDSTRQAPIGGLNRALKRTIDVVGSLIGLVIFAPLLPFLAAAIKLDSSGPVFFVQERAGKHGRHFKMIKLRTMIEGADEMLPELVDLDSLSSPAFKLRDDPRVTSVGHFLRRTSLDELPQLWNVLKGEMSLVGPRPEEARVVKLYNDWHRQRLAIKPGLTGPMQVNGRADLDLDERVRLELEYIHEYSLWKDICILGKTIFTIVSGRGAY